MMIILLITITIPKHRASQLPHYNTDNKTSFTSPVGSHNSPQPRFLTRDLAN